MWLITSTTALFLFFSHCDCTLWMAERNLGEGTFRQGTTHHLYFLRGRLKNLARLRESGRRPAAGFTL